MTEKLCKDCKHFEFGQVTATPCCRHPENLGDGKDYVFGKHYSYSRYGDCFDIRGEISHCGPTGKWFEAKGKP